MPKYSRQTYEMVAQITNYNLSLMPLDNLKHNAFRDGIKCMLIDFEAQFKKDNDKFDAARFRKACGIK